MTLALEPAQTTATRTIGPYELTRRLGAGGMGEVWMGRRSGPGGASKLVAIKLLPTDRVATEVAVKGFLEEARLSMLLSNSNIVQVFDVGHDQGVPYMVMEWVDGLDVSELTERLRSRGKKLPVDIVAYIVGEVLKALAYAHDFTHDGERRTIVHRDVTPHNVMLSITGEVKLMDFGIARLASEDTSGAHVKGKFRYMPPEQLRGRSREPTLDLFAVGAILHELLDGSKFRGNIREEEQLYGVILDGHVDLIACPHEVPSTLDELRLGLLAANVEDRISSARAAFRKLTSWHGYRDAKFDLEDLMRSVVDAGTLPLAPDVTERLLANSPTTLDTTYGSGRSDSKDASTQRDGEAVDASEDQTAGDERRRPAGTGSACVVEPHQPPAMRRTNAIVLSSLLALGGVGFGLFAVGSLAGWWADESAEPTTAEQAPVMVDLSDPRPVAPAPPPVEAPMLEPEPVVEASAVPATEPVDEPPSRQADTSQNKPPEPPPPPKVSKVAVTLKANPKLNLWIEIKIGKDQQEIKRTSSQSASIRLKPGEYGVQYRTEFDGSWKDAGKVTIPRVGRATVVIGTDGKATLAN